MKRLILVLCLGSCLAQASTLQDPTKPSLYKLTPNAENSAVETSPLQLTAIINNAQLKLAIINGKSVEVGQQVQGYSVIFISQDHVILSGSEGKQTLYVNNNNVKKDTNNGF